eukprot:2638764-Rhodomonas_salina.1
MTAALAFGAFVCLGIFPRTFQKTVELQQQSRVRASSSQAKGKQTLNKNILDSDDDDHKSGTEDNCIFGFGRREALERRGRVGKNLNRERE